VADQRDLEPLVGEEQRVRICVPQLWDLEKGDESIQCHVCVGPKEPIRALQAIGVKNIGDGITRSGLNVSSCSRTVPRTHEDAWTCWLTCKACDHA
jgi:hypothetical protein